MQRQLLEQLGPGAASLLRLDQIDRIRGSRLRRRRHSFTPRSLQM